MVDYLEQLLRQAEGEPRQEQPPELDLTPLALSLPGPAGGAGETGPGPQVPDPAGGEGDFARQVRRALHRAAPDPAGAGGREEAQPQPARQTQARSDSGQDGAERAGRGPGDVPGQALERSRPALPPEEGVQGQAAPADWALAAPTRAGRESSALELLYRQVREAAWGESAGQRAGMAVIREGALPAGELTLGGLDRAMRRDSRRYDGGMGAL